MHVLNPGIPLHHVKPKPGEGAVTDCDLEFGPSHPQPVERVKRRTPFRGKVFSVPGAHRLANVTAEEVTFEGFKKPKRNDTPIFDGQI
jgi:hypothetical protein